MYVAGYSFYLLNNIFTSHWGFQNFSSRPPWRAKQMEVNNGKFDEFAKEVRDFRDFRDWPLIILMIQVSAHYNADPYNMLSQLKKMNLKNIKVAYNKDKSKSNKSRWILQIWQLFLQTPYNCSYIQRWNISALQRPLYFILPIIHIIQPCKELFALLEFRSG